MLTTKTDAKNNFLLTEKDLATLNCKLKRSPTYRNVTMKLYEPDELKKLALEKWGSEENINLEKERRLKRRTELQERKRAELDKVINDRRQRLSDELARYGLLIRNDSKLCTGYIYHDEFDIDYVVETCRKMHWLYTKTDYRHRLEKGGMFDRDSVDEMQERIIKEYGGGKPWCY